MERTLKYPVKAFAAAMVLFTGSMRDAMLAGIAVVFGDILRAYLSEIAGEKNRKAASIAAGVITAAVLCGIFVFCGTALDLKTVASFLVIGAMIALDDAERDSDYNHLLFGNAIAFVLMVVLAILREYLAKTTIFGFGLADSDLVSRSFGKPMFAMIGAGLALAVTNRITNGFCLENAALWVCLPLLVLNAPFSWKPLNGIYGSAVGVIAMALLYWTLREKLVFANTDDSTEGIPTELVMIGFLYMIFSLL